MPSWLPSIPYPPEQEGYWSPITSTIDWCEENYYASYYSAEIVNTLTNVVFMGLALKGAYNCWQHGHDRIFLIAFLGFFAVGVGSFAFHSSLICKLTVIPKGLRHIERALIRRIDPMQLFDELSMIYTACLLFWATFSYNHSVPVQVAMGIFSASLAIFITAYYHYLQDPSFHQNTYALLTAITLARSMFVMEVNLRPQYRRKREAALPKPPSAAEVARRDTRDRKILRTMWALISIGLSTFLVGYTLWSLDSHYCRTWRALRHEIGLPWGLLLEGHGWWHLMTGTGAYFYIVWGVWLRHCLNGRQDEFQLVWPSYLTSLPKAVRREGAQANGDAAKKTK